MSVSDTINDIGLLHGTIGDLLVAGGDDRQVLDARNGLNRYGCAAEPRPALPLGSCTSSSPSARSVAAAERMQSQLREAQARGSLESFARRELARIRATLTRLFHVDQVSGSQVALTPSGTDAELLASVLALGSCTRPLCNIITGPGEIGTGSTLAAGGRHFSSITPRGAARAAGEPLDGVLSEQVRIDTIELRDAEGRPRSRAAIDREAEELVTRALAARERVLLHVVAHSKTGAHAPSLRAAVALRRRHGDDVSVVVDAAQGRFSRRGLVDALRDDLMLLITGSKFYGGPPFSGALVVPPSMAPGPREVPEPPAGLRDYFAADELPEDWKALRAGLRGASNLGLLLRWTAALAEVRAYYETDGAARYAVLRAFERLVPEVMGASPYIELDAHPPLLLEDDAQRLLESKTTVFPFCLHRRGCPAERLDRGRLQRVLDWLNSDISGALPATGDAMAETLRESFHLGQPVELRPGGGRAALRVALGGTLIVRVATDAGLGAGLEERIEWLRGGLLRVRDKIELLVEHYDAIAAVSGA